MADDEPKSRRWWHNIPALVTGVTGLLGALAAIIVALYDIGALGGKEKPLPPGLNSVPQPALESQVPSNPTELTLDITPEVNIGVSATVASEATSSRDTDTTQYPLALPSGEEAKAGKAVYKILSAQVDRYSSNKLGLQLMVRVIYSGEYPTTFSSSSFRLLVDGAPLAPEEAPSEVVEPQSAKEGMVLFVVPDGVQRVELQVGQVGEETATIAIDLRDVKGTVQATPSPAEDLMEYPITLPAGAEARAGEAVYKILAAQLDGHTPDKRALQLTIRMTYKGNYPTTFWSHSFRLLVDGVPFAPEEAPNELVEPQSAKEGKVIFVLPRDVKEVELQVGEVGAETATIAITLPNEGR